MNWKFIRIIDSYVGISSLFFLRYLMRHDGRAYKKTSAMKSPEKILFIKFWGIGNIFMMLPSVSDLKSVHPASEIDLLTLKSNRDAAITLGCFNAIYTVDVKNTAQFILSALRAWKAVRRRDYAVIIDFEQFARFSALFSVSAGRHATIGFDTAGQLRHNLYSKPVKYDNNIHVTKSNTMLARAAGAVLEQRGEEKTWTLRRSDAFSLQNVARKLGIDRSKFVITMHVGTSANFRERRWPVENYAKLTDLLVQNHAVQIVITGLTNEAALAEEFYNHNHSTVNVIDAIGHLSFEEYFALIQLSNLVVSADTSAVHIASAVGIPVVGLYGPNTPVLYGPWGGDSLVFYKQLSCSPCITNFNSKINVCKHPEGRGACMKKISAAEVYKEIKGRYFNYSSAQRLKKPPELEKCVL